MMAKGVHPMTAGFSIRRTSMMGGAAFGVDDDRIRELSEAIVVLPMPSGP
jgi:hypothetical protein